MLASCQSYKKVPYLQDLGEAQRAVAEAKLYDARILPKDLLTIVVSCSDPELAEPFNLTVSTPVSNTQKSLTSQPPFNNIWSTTEATSTSPCWAPSISAD